MADWFNSTDPEKPPGRFHEVLKWLPAAAIATFVVLGAAAICRSGSGDSVSTPTPVVIAAVPTVLPFKPIEARPLVFLSPGPFHVGGTVRVQDGICNTSSEILTASTTIGFEEQGKDRLTARSVTVYPRNQPDGSAGVPVLRPIPPGCMGVEPVVGDLPASLPPGVWRLYVTMIAMGSQAGQTQRISVLSPEFEVIP